MRVLCDSSVLIAAPLPGEDHRAASAAVLNGSDSIVVHVHALNETFATLMGGSLGFRVDADLAARSIRERIVSLAAMVVLNAEEVTDAFDKARAGFVAVPPLNTCALSGQGRARPMFSTR